MNIDSPKFKSRVKRVLSLTVAWVIVGMYLSVVQHAAMLQLKKMLEEGKVVENVPIGHNYADMLIGSVTQVMIAGVVLASIEVFYFTDRFRRKSFAYAVLMKTGIYAFGLTFFTIVFIHFDSGLNLDKFANTLIEVFFVWAPIFFISSIFLQVSDKYGQGVLWKFALGKYHSQKVEVRIFMFLDLKSSTTIAEALGNVKYFELLKDFFYDVTDAIIEKKGEIYQYVGDEIVISWKLNNGIENANSLNCFFDICKVIKDHSEKYQKKYNLVPTFKAALHYGEVTVGEVGALKRDITFSGDVLNTTSRIQELCNKYNEKLIVSKNFLNLCSLNNDFILKEIGKMNLRGKAEPIFLYSVNK